jgi:phosphoribosylglycinamide formyltransferase-1
MQKVKLGVLVSGRGSNLQAIIDNIEEGLLPAEIVIVISDQPDAYSLERARKHNIPTIHISAKGYRGKRDEYDALLVTELQKITWNLFALPDSCASSHRLIKAFPNKMLNIHPALLPAFPGLHVQKAALDHGVKFSGCTVHFVDEGMDTGPIIIQAVVPILDNDTVDSLSERILKQEHKIYSRAINLYAEGRLKIDGRRVLVTGGKTIADEFLLNP